MRLPQIQDDSQEKRKPYTLITMRDIEKLKAYHKEGLIPAEGEDEENFLKRALFCQEIKEKLKENMGDKTPQFLDNAPLFKKANEVYGINPSWVPVFCSNEKLLPWQGASAWIFQLEEGDPLSALIQLRGKYIGLLGSREEALTHESTHIARMAFKEPVYEEIIAYSDAKSPLRRFLGPIFRSNAESLTFTSLLILVTVFDLILLLSGSWAMYDKFMWLKLVPLSYFFLLYIRLRRDQKRFSKVKKDLSLPLMLILTDDEITRFSSNNIEEMDSYIKEGKNGSLRRRLLYALRGDYGR